MNGSEAKTNILCNLQKLGHSNAASILLVGAQGVGKHTLATALVNLETSFNLQVRVACSLPLPTDKEAVRPKIDFIVFMIDLTNRQSLKVIEKSLSHVDVHYFIGKTCFVTSDGGSTANQYISSETVRELADNYESSIFHVALKDQLSLKAVAERLCAMLEIAAGFKKDTTSLLIDSTRIPYISQSF